MDFQDDAAEFSSEDVDMIVKNAITGCLTDVMYNPKKVRASERDKGEQAPRTLCVCCVELGQGRALVCVSVAL